ncbi:M-phase-specific PLK1-interacting protein [Amia ocellicauda]|uniref:M-phase-specific PLK1-interacting protein n=1 Tax=Amia ocellicauda TaxID=2972642 RepID=UPI003464178E
MYRPGFRHPTPPGGMGSRPGLYRSPAPRFDNGGGLGGMQAGVPPHAFRGYSNTASPSYCHRPMQFSGKSPNTPPKEFYSNNNSGGVASGGKGRVHSPCQTPRRGSPRYTPPYKQSPFRSHQSPGQMGFQGSPRTSTPFGSAHGRERVANDVEKYYRPSMLEDPWASLQPVTVTDTNLKYNTERTTNTGRKGRYFS